MMFLMYGCSQRRGTPSKLGASQIEMKSFTGAYPKSYNTSANQANVLEMLILRKGLKEKKLLTKLQMTWLQLAIFLLPTQKKPQNHLLQSK